MIVQVFFENVIFEFFLFFFFNDTATTEIYTLSLHDALPISLVIGPAKPDFFNRVIANQKKGEAALDLYERIERVETRSEEHTSELQSRLHLVCRLLLEKKKKLREPASVAHIYVMAFADGR